VLFLSGVSELHGEGYRKSVQNMIQLPVYLTFQRMGTECSPTCGVCKCGRCPTGEKEYTIKEERELDLINNGLKHNAETKRRVFCSHAFNFKEFS
jgi:hypothetical protein